GRHDIPVELNDASSHPLDGELRPDAPPCRLSVRGAERRIVQQTIDCTGQGSAIGGWDGETGDPVKRNRRNTRWQVRVDDGRAARHRLQLHNAKGFAARHRWKYEEVGGMKKRCDLMIL